MLILAALPAWAQFPSIIVLAPNPTEGALAQYTFDGARGNESALSPTTQLAHTVVSKMHRGSGVQASPMKDAFGADGWTKLATPDAHQYFEFTVAPESGWALNLSRLVIGEQSVGSGARQWSLRSSLDGFSQDLARSQTTRQATPGSGLAVDLNDQFSRLSQAVTFRLYGYSAPVDRVRVLAGWPVSIRVPAGVNGSWFLDTLTVTGSVVVPEPATMGCAAGFGLVGLAALRRQRRV